MSQASRRLTYLDSSPKIAQMRRLAVLLWLGGCGETPVAPAPAPDPADPVDVLALDPTPQRHRMQGGPGALSRAEAVVAAGGWSSVADIVELGLLQRPEFASLATWEAAENRWWSHYATTQDPELASAWLFAIGHSGGRASQVRLGADLSVLPRTDDVERHRRGYEAMGVLCSAGHSLDAPGLASIVLGLHGGPDLRGSAAYALSRCVAPSAEWLASIDRHAVVGALTVLLDGTASEAALAWKSFAALGDVPGPRFTSAVGSRDAPWPWWVDVEAVHALAQDRRGRRAMVQWLSGVRVVPKGPRVHAVLVGLSSLRAFVEAEPELLASLAPLREVEGETKSLVLVRCELSVLHAIVDGTTEPVSGCAQGEAGLPESYGDELVVEVLFTRRRHDEVSRLLVLAEDPRPRVAAAALRALAPVDDRRVNPMLRAGVEAGDPGVVTAALASVSSRAITAGRRDTAAIPLLRDRVTAPSDPATNEARLLAVRALGRLARGEDTTADPPAWLAETMLPLADDPCGAIRAEAFGALLGQPKLQEAFVDGWQDLDEPATALPVAPAEVGGLRFETVHGSFTIRFDASSSSAARSSFAELAAKGFYDGLTLHRVVPGFVVQGGDPRGDGYGGPGFTVPLQARATPVDRGTVGLASAGRDTAGSQFFIAQTRQPHLDGQHPIVGRVDEAGMAVVDAILPHDRTLTVEPVPAGDV